MRFYLKHDSHQALIKCLQYIIDSSGVDGKVINAHEIYLDNKADKEQVRKLCDLMSQFGVEIQDDEKEQLLTDIKYHIDQYILEKVKESLSTYLSKKLNLSYRHLSDTFRKGSLCSIESYLIFQRIEFVKKMAVEENLTLTEIAFEMNYSSVAHLSRQFKETTGLTFQTYQQLISHRVSKKLLFSPSSNFR